MKRAKDFPRILLYREHTDMRKQSLGLARLVESELKENPFNACLFVFGSVAAVVTCARVM